MRNAELEGRALFRADAAMRCSASWDSELCAGEMLRLAGYRPAVAWVRAGVGRRGDAVLLRREGDDLICRVSRSV